MQDGRNGKPVLEKLVENAILFLLGGVLLCLPYGWNTTSYMIGALCGLALIYQVCFRRFGTFRTSDWKSYAWGFVPMVALFLLDLAGMAYAPADASVGFVLEKHLSFVAFPFLFIWLGKEFFTLRRLQGLGIVFCVSCLLVVGLFLYNAALASVHPALRPFFEEGQWLRFFNALAESPSWYIARYGFFIMHHTLQSWYMLVAMSIIAYTWIVWPQWYRKWYVKLLGLVLLVLFSGVGIFLSISKTGYLVFGFWILLIGLVLLQKRHYKTVAGGLVGLVLVTGVLFAEMPRIRHSVSNAWMSFKVNVWHDGQTNQENENVADTSVKQVPDYHDGSVYTRWLLWQEALDGIKERPLFGWGTAGEVAVVNKQREDIQYKGHDPHNEWLLYGIRFGLVGILALAWLWFVGFRHAYRYNNGLLAVFLLLSFCFTLPECVFEGQVGITLFCLMYGLCLAFSQYTKTSGTKS